MSLTGHFVSWSNQGPEQWTLWAETQQADLPLVWWTGGWGWTLDSHWCPGFLQRWLLWTDEAGGCLGPVGPHSLPPLSAWRNGSARNLAAGQKKGGEVDSDMTHWMSMELNMGNCCINLVPCNTNHTTQGPQLHSDLSLFSFLSSVFSDFSNKYPKILDRTWFEIILLNNDFTNFYKQK